MYDNSKVSMQWGLELKPYLQYKSQMNQRFKDQKSETMKVSEDNMRVFFIISQWQKHY